MVGPPARWVLVSVCAVLASNLISTLFSPSISVSFWGREPAFDGYGFYNTLSHFVLFAVVASHLKSTAQLWRLLGAIVASGVAVGFYGILQYFALDPFGVHNGGMSIISSLGNRVFAAAYLLLVAPVTIAMALRFQRQSARWISFALWAAVLSVPVMAIAFTGARGPWLGLATAFVAIAALALMTAGWRTMARASLLVAVSLAVTWLVITFIPPGIPSTGVPATRIALGTQALSIGRDVQDALVLEVPEAEETAQASGAVAPSSVSTRLLLWRTGLKLVQDRPWFEVDDRTWSLSLHLFGYGPEFFQYLFPLEMPEDVANLSRELIYYYPADAHNYIVHRTVELGLWWLISYLLLLGALVAIGISLLLNRSAFTTTDQKLVASAVLASVAGRTVEQLVGIPHLSDEALFWTLIAVLVALPGMTSSPRQRDEMPERIQHFNNLSAHTFLAGRGAVLGLALALASVVVVFTIAKNPSYALAENRATVAQSSLQNGDLQKAMRQIEDAIARAPNVGRYRVMRAQILDQARNLSDNPAQLMPLAQEAYLANREAVTVNPFDFYNSVHLAESALVLAGLNQVGMSEEAIVQYKRVTIMLPRYWLSHFLLGRAYGETEQPELAVAAYGEAIELNPASRLTLDQRAQTYVLLGDYTSAKKGYDQIIALHPRGYSAYHQRALASFALGRIEDAITDLDVAIDQLGKDLRIIEDPEEAMLLVPRLALAHNNRGTIYQEAAEVDRAIEDYNEAIRYSPEFGEAYMNRGLAFATLGRIDEAKRDLTRAAEMGVDLSFLGVDPEFISKQQ